MLCRVEGCDDRVKSRRYCNRHYLQVVFYGQQPTARRRHDTLVRDAEGRKRCVTCSDWKPESDFHKAKNCKDGFASTCITCARKKYAHKQRQRHGLTEDDFVAIVEAQGGKCVCGSLDPVAIDHDHRCCPGKYGCRRCVRGILCQPCNSILAFARDSPHTLRRLADYLEK